MNENAKKKNWFARHKVMSVILGVIVVVVIASAAGSKSPSKPSQPAAPDKSSTAASTPAATPAPAKTPQVLLDLQGSGTKSTQKFTASGDWDLDWSYDCSSFGNSGNFQVFIYTGSGSPSTSNSPVNELGASGSDTEHYHTGGTFYLEVNSECTWHVTAKG